MEDMSIFVRLCVCERERERVCVCVCLCARAHLCRNHQVSTCARIKETFDKWSISLEALRHLLEIALGTDDWFLEDQGRDQVD